MPRRESYPELQAQARLLGIRATGTRPELELRITAHLEQLAKGTAKRAARVGDDDIRVTQWAGRDNYHCAHCTFASLKRRTTVIHIAEQHLE